MWLKGLNYDWTHHGRVRWVKTETIFPSLNDQYMQTMVTVRREQLTGIKFSSRRPNTGREVVQAGDTVSQSNSDRMSSSNDQLRHQ